MVSAKPLDTTQFKSARMDLPSQLDSKDRSGYTPNVQSGQHFVTPGTGQKLGFTPQANMAKTEDEYTPQPLSESHFNIDDDKNMSLKKEEDLEKNNRVLVAPEPPVMTKEMEEDMIHRKEAADLYYERDANKWF